MTIHYLEPERPAHTHQPRRKPPHGRMRSGVWREEANARATRLKSEARSVLSHSTLSEPDSTRIKRIADREIIGPLKRVEEITHDDPVTFLEWLSGSQVEEAWRLLRQAEEGLLRVLDNEHLEQRTALVIEHGRSLLGDSHPLLKELRERASAKQVERLRSAALNVLALAHEESDRRHRQMRSFRNQLLAVSTTLVVLACGALIGQWFMRPRFLGLTENTGLGKTTALAIVMVSGCIGALFSAIPSLAQVPEKTTSFGLIGPQALLKVVTGGWSAVVGLLAVEAGVSGQAAEITSVGGLVMLAALFGAGQEAVTRFADHKATTVRSVA